MVGDVSDDDYDDLVISDRVYYCENTLDNNTSIRIKHLKQKC